MICDVSSQQFQSEILLVPEQIANIEWRVGMSSPEGGGTRCWYVTWRWLLWRQMISSPPWWSPWDIEMDGVEMESGWMVTTLHSVCDSNVTGGDRHHLRSHSFNPNDKGGCHFLPVRSNLHSASFKNSHKARWEVIGKDGKTCLLCPICGQRREQAKSLENTKRRSLQMKRGGQGWVSLSPTASCILVCIHAWVYAWVPYESLLSSTVFAKVQSQQKSSDAPSLLCLLDKILIVMMYDSEDWWKTLTTLRASEESQDPQQLYKTFISVFNCTSSKRRWNNK